MKYIVHTDGGARGNPGPAAVGVVIEIIEQTAVSGQPSDISNLNAESSKQKAIIAGFGKRIGETTNNVAEYTAVIEALKYLKERQRTSDKRQEHTTDTYEFFLDSTLVVHQLNGLYKVKEPRLRELLSVARVLEQEVGGTITYSYVPREQNSHADYFVNKAMDDQS
jgi:ribonuclease HI